MRRTAPLLLVLLVLLVACRAVQGAVIGGATGALGTGTPQGVAVGGAAGFIVGAWDDITAYISSLWRGWFGGGLPTPAPPTPSHLIEYVAIGLGAYFVWKFVTDYEFRYHLFNGLKKSVNPKPPRNPNAP